MLGPVRPEATAHGVWRPATRGWPKGLAGPRPGGLRASAGSRARAMARWRARLRQGVAREYQWAPGWHRAMWRSVGLTQEVG
jgi:hypothetical protein